ncbi:DALR anticodon-binding domain-containing protein [Ruania albidiflava]|uniref:DALR anticodon-binding domain-containing protein n=1 Tax=Ruania albidiflava TaxID=366586 RepID=UPI0023F3447B|nr:DALR anticodon-binding domain-containing protein [Ruania albidiflava]
MPEELTGLLRACAQELGLTPPEQIPLRPVEPRSPGDWSTALAHQVAPTGQGAAQVAAALADRLRHREEVAGAHADSGHLTLTLSLTGLAGPVRRLRQVRAGATMGPRSAAQPGSGCGCPAELHPVAFAHARSRNVARTARAHGVRPLPGDELEPALTAVVEERTARYLLVLLGAFAPARPERAAGGAQSTGSAQRLGRSILLRTLAATYQDFYTRTRCAPRGTEPVTSTHRTHLTLTEATSVALATGLSALGVPAPEHL